MTGAPGVDWFAVPGTREAHGFPATAWMRSLCGELRWNALLEHDAARPRCAGCAFLADGVQVAPVAPRNAIDTEARRRAIARAQCKRRWRRTS